MEAGGRPGSKLGSYYREIEPVRRQAEPAQSAPKTRPKMKTAVIWSEIISPPLARRKKNRPYTLPR